MKPNLPQRLLSAALLVALWPHAAHPSSASPDEAAARAYRVERREERVTVDGRLEEEVWSQLPVATDFVQTEPNEGRPATERTEAYAFHDASALYFAFRCHDSEPARVTTRIDQRDQVRASDRVGVFLDTFNDRRNGYDFTVSSRGVQSDSLVFEGAGGVGFDSNWNAIWESAAVIDETGYTVEIRIPFASLRFAPGAGDWGFNLMRAVPRKNERNFWHPIRRVDATMRPSRAGTLSGLAAPKPRRKIDYIPYVSGSARSVRAAPSPGASLERRLVFAPNAGVDVKIPLTPSLVADVTVNPDFGQTEADVEDVSSSRFEVFLPEKREFFTEGADVFRTPIQLFFSRRIGQRLSDGVEQRIAGGVRVTGQIAGFRVGLLEAVTARRAFRNPNTGREEVAPAANFFVLRARRNILERSSVGFITVNRDQTAGRLFAPQRAHGIDISLTRGRDITWSTQLAFSQNRPQPDLLADPTGRTLKKFSAWESRALTTAFRYLTNKWEVEFNARDIGRGFNVSQIGFSPVNDRVSFGGSVEYKPRLEGMFARQLWIEASFGRGQNHRGELESQSSGGRVRAQFRNFWTASVFTNSSSERYYDFFEDVNPSTGLSIRRRYDGRSRDLLGNTLPQVYTLYGSQGWGANVRTSGAGNFTYEAQYNQGGFIDFADNFAGHTRSLLLRAEARLGDNFRADLSGTVIRDYFPTGAVQETRGLFVGRGVYLLSKDTRVRVLAQYNIAARRFSLNTLYFRQFTARSGFGVGYDDAFSTASGLAPLDRQLFFKYSKLF
jgi:hypothetical protein